MPVPVREQSVRETRTASAVPLVARFLPSLTDIAFLMPLIFLFLKLGGARTLLGDGDTGWHIRTGEWILANGRVPTTDMFSFSRPGAPWFAWEWLWDVAFAGLRMRWGMSAVVAASVLVICVANALLFQLIRRHCENGLVAIAVTLLATGGCAIHWLARPHLFTQLFLIVTLHITFRAAEGRTKLLWWLVPLTLLWTNLHGGFFVVFLVLACYIGHGLMNAVIERVPARRAEYLAGLKPWAAVFVCSFAVTFINPYGWQLHKHVVEYLADPYQMRYIAEFQSMSFHSPLVAYVEPLMLLSVMAAFRDISLRRFSDAFLSLGWLHLALLAQRNWPLFAIAAAPSIARAIIESLDTARASGLADWLTKAAAAFTEASGRVELIDRIGRVHLVSGLALTAITAVLLLNPPNAGVLNSKVTSTYDPGKYPENALALLRSPETQRIFADDEWGDYLIYQLYPSRKVFVDGRSDFYGDDFGERYLDALNVKWGWQQTLDKYRIDTIVVSPKFALWRPPSKFRRTGARFTTTKCRSYFVTRAAHQFPSPVTRGNQP